MKAAVVVAMVLSVVIPLANGSALAQGNPQEDTVAVRGMVVDDSGAPVEGISVSVRHYPGTWAVARSAADGSFTLDVPRRSFDGVLLVASDESGDGLGTFVHPDHGRGDDEPIRVVVRKAHKLDVTVTDSQGELVTGARVAAIYRQQPIAEQTTDEGGRAVLRVPAGVQMVVYAVKRDVGFESARLMPESYEQLKLALKETIPLRIHVVDDQRRAIPGATMSLLSATGMGSPPYSISLYGATEFQGTTDDTGVATFHLPPDTAHHFYAPVQINVEAEGYIRPWVWWMSDEALRQGVRMQGGSAVVVSGSEFTVGLKPAVVVRGTVVHADGRPAAGAAVGAFGAGYDKTSYVQGAKCDAEGAFKLPLQSGLYYVFHADSATERSRDQTRVVVADRPMQPLKIVLQPGRRIHGTLTRGPDKTPVAWQHLSLYWRDDASYSKLPTEEQLPNPTSDRASIALGITTNSRTDGQGRFEFVVAPGRYYVISPDNRNPSIWQADPSALPLVDVTEQPEARIDVHSEALR